MKYENIDALIKDVGESEVHRLFVEYFLLLQAKSFRFDILNDSINVDEYLEAFKSKEGT